MTLDMTRGPQSTTEMNKTIKPHTHIQASFESVFALFVSWVGKETPKPHMKTDPLNIVEKENLQTAREKRPSKEHENRDPPNSAGKETIKPRMKTYPPKQHGERDPPNSTEKETLQTARKKRPPKP